MSFVDKLLSEQISLTLVHQAFESKNLTVGSSAMSFAKTDAEQSYGASIFAAFPRSYQDQLIREFAEVAAVAASVGHVDISQAGLRKYYLNHESSFVEICASHISSSSAAAAAAVSAKLAAGMPFTEAVSRYSTDTATASKGGAIGCAPASQYVQALGKTAAGKITSLKTGEVSKPFSLSANDYEIVKVTSRKQETFAQAKAQIRSQLLANTGTAINKYVAHLGASAEIRVNPSYGKAVVTKGQLSVVPPTSPTSSVIGLSKPGG